MNLLLLTVAILGSIVCLLILLNIFIWRWTIGWAPTTKGDAEKIIQLARIEEGDKLFDLGCGDGRFLLMGAKRGSEVTGIEIEPLRYLISKVRALLSKNRDKINVKYGNFFNLNLKEADVVILYLSPRVNEKLKPKLEKELTSGTVVISYQYKLPNWSPTKKIREKEIYHYRFPKSMEF
ncbi:hypothetical protein C9439_06625 [archaeon SCG-AAA382B04]|nr:hypothetical protein C9439_06625 [archaeon SCG-AAA382B04]